MEKIYVSMTQNGFDRVLVKNLPRKYLDADFNNLYTEMVNSAPNDYFSGFTEEDKPLLRSLKTAYDTMKNNGDITLGYIPNNDPNTLKEVQLTDIVKDQPNILKESESMFGDDTDQFEEMRLVVETKYNGGRL